MPIEELEHKLQEIDKKFDIQSYSQLNAKVIDISFDGWDFATISDYSSGETEFELAEMCCENTNDIKTMIKVLKIVKEYYEKRDTNEQD